MIPIISASLTSADIIVLVAYLIIIITIAYLAARRIKTTNHYFLGARSFGKWVMIGQSFGTGTHAEMPVALSGAVYSIGLSGIWFQWKNLFVTPFYWLLAPLFRRFRRTTMSEVMDDRYGPWMAAVYTIFGLCFFTINLASMLKGAAKVIEQALGGGIPVNGLVIGMTLVFVLYSFLGGLIATAWTDVVQGLLIILLSFMLIPLGWHYVGGFAGMKEALGESKFLLTAPDGISLWAIAVLTLNGLIGIVAQPHLIASAGTGRNEAACRTGLFYGNLIKRICTIGWAIVGLMAAVLIINGTFGITQLDDPEEAFGFACRHLLFPGGIGLLIACLLASNMAGCSAFMVDSGAMVINGIYGKYIKRDAQDSHYLLAGRIAGILVTLVAVLYAVFLVKRVLYSFLLTETMATFMGVGIFGGIVWKRANRWGAISSLCVAMCVNFTGYIISGQRLDHWSPGVFFVSLLSGIATLVIVSLLTPPEPAAKTNAFRNRLQEPSDCKATEEINTSAGISSTREFATKGRLLLLVNLLAPRKAASGVPLRKAYATDLRGFIFGCVLIAIVVAGFALAMRL